MRKIYQFCLLSAAAAVLFSGCAKTANEEQDSFVQETEDASHSEAEALSLAVTFEGQDMEGNAVSSEIFSESKLTMVNVWATYCNPCLNEMPGLGELAAAYEPEEFQIVGIISDVLEGEDPDMMDLASDLIAQTGADYTHLLLNESLYRALLTDVTAVPTTFFVNENGEILDTVVGSMEKSAWEEKINALLEE